MDMEKSSRVLANVVLVALKRAPIESLGTVQDLFNAIKLCDDQELKYTLFEKVLAIRPDPHPLAALTIFEEVGGSYQDDRFLEVEAKLRHEFDDMSTAEVRAFLATPFEYTARRTISKVLCTRTEFSDVEWIPYIVQFTDKELQDPVLGLRFKEWIARCNEDWLDKFSRHGFQIQVCAERLRRGQELSLVVSKLYDHHDADWLLSNLISRDALSGYGFEVLGALFGRCFVSKERRHLRRVLLDKMLSAPVHDVVQQPGIIYDLRLTYGWRLLKKVRAGGVVLEVEDVASILESYFGGEGSEWLLKVEWSKYFLERPDVTAAISHEYRSDLAIKDDDVANLLAAKYQYGCTLEMMLQMHEHQLEDFVKYTGVTEIDLIAALRSYAVLHLLQHWAACDNNYTHSLRRLIERILVERESELREIAEK